MAEGKRYMCPHDTKNITLAADGVEMYRHRIFEVVDQYIQEHGGIDLAEDIDQYRWKSVLLYIYNNLFKNDRYILRVNGHLNLYDMDKLNGVYDIYIELCYQYGKMVIPHDFRIMTGLDQETFYGWSRENGHRFNPKNADFCKKLHAESEDSIATMMVTSGKNPVGYIAWLNHYHGWATTAAAHGDAQRRTPEEIAAAHAVQLPEKQAIPLPEPGFLGQNDGEELGTIEFSDDQGS